jgi:hypothetical protein
MKTSTLLAASTRNGFRYLGALALTAALAGCSGAPARGPSTEAFAATRSLQTEPRPEGEWPVRHHRHPELGKCLVTPETNQASSRAVDAEASFVEGPSEVALEESTCGAR